MSVLRAFYSLRPQAAVSILVAVVALAGCSTFGVASTEYRVIVSNNDDVQTTVSVDVTHADEYVITANRTLDSTENEVFGVVEEPGNYTITVTVDGQQAATKPFRARTLDDGRVGFVMVLIDEEGTVSIIVKRQQGGASK
jgi:uncharacterized lipoprotein YajG